MRAKMTKFRMMTTRDILKLLNKWPTYNSIVSATLAYLTIFGIQYFIEFGGYGTVILISTLGLPILVFIIAVAIYSIFSLLQSFHYSQKIGTKTPAVLSTAFLLIALILPKFDYNYEANIIKKRTDDLDKIVSLARNNKLQHNQKYEFRKDAVLIPEEFGILSEYDCFVSDKSTFMVEIAPRNPYWTMTFVEDTTKWTKRNDEIFRRNIRDNWFFVKYDFN